MTPFKQARLSAGLSVKEAAQLLLIDPVSVRRFEMDPIATKTSRTAPPLAIRVLEWYAQGLIPLDTKAPPYSN